MAEPTPPGRLCWPTAQTERASRGREGRGGWSRCPRSLGRRHPDWGRGLVRGLGPCARPQSGLGCWADRSSCYFWHRRSDGLGLPVGSPGPSREVFSFMKRRMVPVVPSLFGPIPEPRRERWPWSRTSRGPVRSLTSPPTSLRTPLAPPHRCRGGPGSGHVNSISIGPPDGAPEGLSVGPSSVRLPWGRSAAGFHTEDTERGEAGQSPWDLGPDQGQALPPLPLVPLSLLCKRCSFVFTLVFC